jgi:GntR family transcriptional regulator/MocR family aminotransferase
LVEPLTMARTLMDGHTASMTQLTVAKFLEGGHFGSYVRMMRGFMLRAATNWPAC